VEVGLLHIRSTQIDALQASVASVHADEAGET
jgi:hypothetical protein